MVVTALVKYSTSCIILRLFYNDFLEVWLTILDCFRDGGFICAILGLVSAILTIQLSLLRGMQYSVKVAC